MKYTNTVYTTVRDERNRFSSRISTPMRDIDIAILSVCPSVRDVPVLDENGLTYCRSFSPNHSSFINIKHLHEIPTGAINIGWV